MKTIILKFEQPTGSVGKTAYRLFLFFVIQRLLKAKDAAFYLRCF
jgi:hypothetical protein